MKTFRSFFLIAVCLFNFTFLALAQTDELSLIQITSVPSLNGVTARGTSYDGKRIVFESQNDYTGENKDGNNEIFVYDVDSRTFIQVTKTENVKDPADTTKILLNVTNTSPIISGDGNHIVFTSNAKLTATPNDDGNQEIYLANLPRNSTSVTFVRITDTDKNVDNEVVKEIFNNFSPMVNADGTIIAFISSRRVFRALENGTPQFTALLEGPNRDQVPDGNNEIFLYNLTTKLYSQVTISRDIDATDGFTVKGFNANPHLSGNGQILAFLSGFNYPGPNAGNNADFNGEIFIYRVGEPSNTFRQLTNTTGTAAVPSNGVVNLLTAFTRPLNFAGTQLVFESAGDLTDQNADKTREIFLANLSGAQPVITQITNQTTADANKSDFNFLPSINSVGTFITFDSVLNLVPTTPSDIKTDNNDGSREVFRYDIAGSTPTAPKFRQLTFTQPHPLLSDQRAITSLAYADDSGSLITFDYIAALLAPNSTAATEIFQEKILPIATKNGQAATIVNGASFDATQVALSSIAAAFGTMLANDVILAPTANLPYELGGVRLTIGGIAARLLFVSPGQINFVIPSGIAIGDAIELSINNNGIQSAGKVKIVAAAPGVFTLSGTGTGSAAAQCGAVIDVTGGQQFVYSNPPCDVGTPERPNFLILFGTGWRNASTTTTVKIGEETLTPIFAGAQPDYFGLDQMNISLPQSLKGKGQVDLIVTSGGVASKTVKVEFK